VHSGTSAESGHYYCYARSLRSDDDGDDQSKWFLFNDSHVTPTTFTSLKELLGRFLRDTAYVLMYRKADVDAFADEVVADSRQLINRDLLRKIEADNEIFMKVSLSDFSFSVRMVVKAAAWLGLLFHPQIKLFTIHK